MMLLMVTMTMTMAMLAMTMLAMTMLAMTMLAMTMVTMTMTMTMVTAAEDEPAQKYKGPHIDDAACKTYPTHVRSYVWVYTWPAGDGY